MIDVKNTILTFVATVGVIVAGAINGISAPLLVELLQVTGATPYYIILFSSIVFFVVISCAFIPYKIFVNRPDGYYSLKQIGLHIVVGFLGALYSIILVYTSNPVRTPIVFQAVFSGLLPVLTIVFSKIIVKRKRNVKFVNRYVVCSILLLACSIILTAVIQAIRSVWDGYSFLWMICYFSGICALSLYNTSQEKYMELNGFSLNNQFTILFWLSFYKVITLVFLFWIDLIPWFGYSHFDTFLPNSLSFMVCIAGITCKATLPVFIAFILAIIGSYVSGVYLNTHSASFNMLAITLISPIVILFFQFVPSLNQGDQFPIYIVIPVIILNMMSILIWQYWDLFIMRPALTLSDQEDSIHNWPQLIDDTEQ
jgi:hypothetical protein